MQSMYSKPHRQGKVVFALEEKRTSIKDKSLNAFFFYNGGHPVEGPKATQCSGLQSKRQS